LAFASGNHELDRWLVGWIEDREGNDACLALPAMTSVTLGDFSPRIGFRCAADEK
jgi:hypothetical protein